jgi:hypothetical protein
MNLNKEMFLAAAMAFSLAACGGDEAPEQEDTTGSEDTYVAPQPQPQPEPEPEPMDEPMDEPVDYAPVEE